MRHLLLSDLLIMDCTVFRQNHFWWLMSQSKGLINLSWNLGRKVLTQTHLTFETYAEYEYKNGVFVVGAVFDEPYFGGEVSSNKLYILNRLSWKVRTYTESQKYGFFFHSFKYRKQCMNRARVKHFLSCSHQFFPALCACHQFLLRTLHSKPSHFEKILIHNYWVQSIQNLSFGIWSILMRTIYFEVCLVKNGSD